MTVILGEDHNKALNGGFRVESIICALYCEKKKPGCKVTLSITDHITAIFIIE